GLEIRFNEGILRVEIGQVRNEILHDRHRRQWIDGDGSGNVRNRLGTGERIAACNVHRTGPADSFAAGTAKGQGRIDLVLDLDQGVENHWTAALQIDRIGVEARIGILVRIEAINLEILRSL